ncbi:hypothetical protein [Exiguobacterium mexicanum]|uniref:hypothetical protein n=1 Tax=Exiguobacterium mexicanum TaxID=340146 RepID=UPI0037C0CF7F
MEIVRQPIRQIDEIEYEHFKKYGQNSYGMSAEELKGIFVEMGKSRCTQPTPIVTGGFLL